MKHQLNENAERSYKIGMNEITGLREAMARVMGPVRASIAERAYWTRCDLDETEYKRRDGFIPYASNCGGLEVSVIVPKCEESSWSFLEFGECEDCGNAETYPEGDHQCGYKGVECAYESEGYLDAQFRVWLKFEGIDDETNELCFYLYASGGNEDAPYFRTKYEADIFEAEFRAKSVMGISRAASKYIKKLMKVIEE